MIIWQMASRFTTPFMRSLTFLIGLSTSLASLAPAQQPERRASVEARAASIQDSLRARSGSLEGDIERIAAQLLIASQLQAQVRQALAEMLSNRTDQDRAQVKLATQRLRQQLEQATQQSQGLRSRLASLCDRNAKPDGYMGITFSATMRADAAASGTEIFRFAENPTVETVEPGSPAELAGVEKGDEIILINRQAVVGRDIVFNQLLRPGNRLPIRVRRDGDTRDVTLLITQRPPSLDNGCPFLDARIMAAFGDPISIGQLPLSGAIVRSGPQGSVSISVPGQRVRVLRPAEPGAVASTAPNAPVTVAIPPALVPNVPLPAPAVAEAGPRGVFVFSGSSAAPMVIAGATIVRTNSDLRETFGVKSGVLVLDVARGSPAYASGLKGGDIIISAGRGAVTSPLSIQRALEAADGNELRLRIIRKKKEQPLTLRW